MAFERADHKVKEKPGHWRGELLQTNFIRHTHVMIMITDKHRQVASPPPPMR
jgi:hypothetical protein